MVTHEREVPANWFLGLGPREDVKGISAQYAVVEPIGPAFEGSKHDVVLNSAKKTRPAACFITLG